ncbi:MAG: hypothetical protein RLZZ326_664 [Planctomycetota bacterium]|jgi:2-polyprenyl-3-methyl-5-hydroxy-6-metoxy-1,4-benzoquinol methylase
MIDISGLYELSRISYSPSHAEKVAFQYWSTATETHGDMSESSFDFFFEKIRDTMKPRLDDRILDYGCGSGEILHRFVDAGFNAEGCETSPGMVERTRQAGLRCGSCDEVLRGGRQFDAVFANGVFLFVHPARWEQVLRALRKLITPNGSLYLFDNPDLTKRHQLGMGRKRMLLTSFLPIYQPQMAAFFIHPRKLERAAHRAGFGSFAILDSWCDYRTHFIMH